MTKFNKPKTNNRCLSGHDRCLAQISNEEHQTELHIEAKED